MKFRREGSPTPQRSPRRAASLRNVPFALVALFAVVGAIAAFAYAINAWQVFGFARHVWQLPLPLCYGASVVADALSLAGLFATYLLRSAPRKVRAYAWFVFLGMTGLSIAAAESFASWRRLTVAERASHHEGAMVAAAAIVIALALAVHLLIVSNRHARPDTPADLAEAEAVAGVPVDLVNGDEHPGVYRALGDNPVPPIYIGSTTALARRIVRHKDISGWYPQVRRWTFEPYATIDEAQIAERMLIEAEQPIYNTNHRKVTQPPRSRAPEGTVIEQVPPSVDVKSAPTPRPPQKLRSIRQGRPANPETAGKRDGYARRVIEGGERPADVALDAGVSKRAVELWVKAYRERQPQTSAATIELGPDDKPADQHERPQLATEEVTA